MPLSIDFRTGVPQVAFGYIHLHSKGRWLAMCSHTTDSVASARPSHSLLLSANLVLIVFRQVKYPPLCRYLGTGGTANTAFRYKSSALQGKPLNFMPSSNSVNLRRLYASGLGAWLLDLSDILMIFLSARVNHMHRPACFLLVARHPNISAPGKRREAAHNACVGNCATSAGLMKRKSTI